MTGDRLKRGGRGSYLELNVGLDRGVTKEQDEFQPAILVLDRLAYKPSRRFD